MRRERTERVRSIMQTQGIDALVLLGNTNVIYATGAVWPLADSGRTHFEQPVAVVLADDEFPHIWSPVHDDERLRADLPADHLHGPVYLDFDEGVAAFAAQLAALTSTGAAIAVDEWTHALRRNEFFFAGGPPLEGGKVISRAKLVKTPDELSCMRTSLHITEIGIAEVQAQLAPGVRQTDLTATFLRTIFDHGADANILEPIWQVMTPSMSDGPWTTTGGLACPLLSTERELVEGDVLWVDTCVTWNGYHSDFGRTWIVGREPDARQREQFERWKAIIAAVLDVTRAGATGADLTAAAHRRGRRREAVDVALLPRPRARHRQRRDAVRRQRHRRGVRRRPRAASGQRPRARADRVGRRRRRLPLRGGRPDHRGRVGTDDRLPVRPVRDPSEPAEDRHEPDRPSHP